MLYFPSDFSFTISANFFAPSVHVDVSAVVVLIFSSMTSSEFPADGVSSFAPQALSTLTDNTIAIKSDNLFFIFYPPIFLFIVLKGMLLLFDKVCCYVLGMLLLFDRVCCDHLGMLLF